ncbi:HYR domain-containing protein, partial [Maribellus sp. YY47]|uniref:HYR domain-containing protein n=1 Tax=Maribellus sp. YY47 TaxID=2929486 RepID=UPI002001C25D
MTKLLNSQTCKLTVALIVILSVFIEPTSVKADLLRAFEGGTVHYYWGGYEASVENQFSETSGTNTFLDDTTGIVCPEDISTYTDVNSCNALISSGLELLDPGNTLASLTWQMEGATVGSSSPSGINQLTSYLFNEGTTVVTYQGRDKSNQAVFCSFMVLVADNEVPRLMNPPSNISLEADPGDCHAVVNWADPIVLDNCASRDQILVDANYLPGSAFPVGTTEVIISFSDGMEYNRDEYSFTVTVTDDEIPQIFAPHPVFVKCGNPVPDAFTSLQEFTEAGGVAIDNCNIAEESFRFVSQKASDFSCPYTVTRVYSIADDYGNVTEVEHLVHVTDSDEMPQELQAEPQAEPQAEAEEELVLKSGMATIYSTGIGGAWSESSTWEGGVVPGPDDDVVIVVGATVTVNGADSCSNIEIESGATLNHSGTTTLSVYGNWTNNGTYSSGSGIVEFTGSTDATISGSSSTDFNAFVLNKGADVSSSLEINSVGAVSLGSYTFASGLLVLTTGTYTFSDAFDIPEPAGIHVNGATLTTGDFSIDNRGLIRISSGVANFGISSGNSVQTMVDGAFEVSGGIVNIAGRLENSAGGYLIDPTIPSGINISGGTINLAMVGNGLSGTGALNVTQQGAFSFTAGTINIINANSTTGTAVDLAIEEVDGSGTKTITNGIFHFGDGTANTYQIISAIDIPNITTANQTELEITRTIDANGTYTFNLSDGSGNEIPVEITITADSYSSDASIKVTTTDGVFATNESDINYLSRYWTVDLTGITNPVYSVTADYRPADIVGTESEIKAGAWNGTSWTKGNVAGGNTITFNGLTGDLNISGITAADPTVTASVNKNVVCEGDDINLESAPIGDAPFSFAWKGPNGFTSTDQNPTRTNLSTTDAGTYSVTVTDGNGFTASDNVAVTVNTIPTVSASLTTQQVCPGEPITQIEISNPNNVAGTSFSWTRDNTTTLTGLESGIGNTISGIISSSTPTVLETTTFTITASANGCSSQTTVEVIVGDDEAPQITVCATDQDVNVDAGSCEGTVPDLTGSITATDNCSFTVTQSPVAGTKFGSIDGSTQVVTITVTDPAGNTDDCTATLTLVDNIAPQITVCATDQDVNVDAGSCEGTVPDLTGSITATDNCSFTVTQSPV